MIPGSGFLPSGYAALYVWIDKVPYRPFEAGLKENTGQRQQRQFLVVPLGQTTNVHVRIRLKLAKIEFFAARRAHLRHIVHRQNGTFFVTLQLNFVPMTIVEFLANGDDLSTAAQVETQPQRTLHQFYLKKVISAAVVRVQQHTVWLVGLEFEFQRAVGASAPFAELRVRLRTAVQ